MTDAVLAHHPLIIAVPAFAPAIIIVGVVVYIAVRDRRLEARERMEQAAGDGERPDAGPGPKR